MKERQQEARTFIVDALCPKCETVMVYDGNIALAVYPPRYAHRCPQCGWMEEYSTPYPRVEYERIEPKEG